MKDKIRHRVIWLFAVLLGIVVINRIAANKKIADFFVGAAEKSAHFFNAKEKDWK